MVMPIAQETVFHIIFCLFMKLSSEIKALPTFGDLLSPPSLPTLRELLNLSSVAGLQEHDRGPAAISLEENWYEYSDEPLDRMDRVGHDYYYYYDYPADRQAGPAGSHKSR